MTNVRATDNACIRAESAFRQGERIHATTTSPEAQPQETAGAPGQ
jgi:Tfp pilus assembly protein PilX